MSVPHDTRYRNRNNKRAHTHTIKERKEVKITKKDEKKRILHHFVTAKKYNSSSDVGLLVKNGTPVFRLKYPPSTKPPPAPPPCSLLIDDGESQLLLKSGQETKNKCKTSTKKLEPYFRH